MKVDFTDNGERAKLLKNVKRVVVKVGSRLLMDVENVSARQRVEELVKEIAGLRDWHGAFEDKGPPEEHGVEAGPCGGRPMRIDGAVRSGVVRAGLPLRTTVADGGGSA